jgi:hypothetical protein
MADLESTYRMRKFDQTTTLVVTVRLTREFRLRMWIALQLFKLASRVLNCGFRLEEAE